MWVSFPLAERVDHITALAARVVCNPRPARYDLPGPAPDLTRGFRLSAEGSEWFPSRFAGIQRRTALAVLSVVLALLAWCLSVACTRDVFASDRPPSTREVKPDSEFYKAVVARVRDGQGYYEAAREEFALPIWSEGGFRPTSVFNWRTPLYAWMLSRADAVVDKTVVAGLGLVAATLCFLALGRSLGPGPAVLTFLLTGPLAWCILGDVYLFTELWAGILIALSVGAYGLGRWPVAVIAAVAALFLRELVLPYCLLCLVLAAWERRWKEVTLWVVGLGLFGLFYAWHVQQVFVQIADIEKTHGTTWLAFGGMPFVLAAVQIGNVFLTAAPTVLAAVLLPFALLGLAGWRGEAGLRAFLACLGYLTFLLMAGNPPYNAYWGLLIGPLVMLGLAALPPSVRDLWTALRNPAAEKPPAIQ